MPDAVTELAGDNVGQLRSVLRHYAGHPQKYLAARYLVDNMGHSYVVSSRSNAYRASVLTSDAHTVAELNALWLAVVDSMPADASRRERDAEVLSAEYLISNIDEAFDVWRRSPWKRQVNFRTFCRYILPYRVLEEPPSNWRKPLNRKYAELLAGVSDLRQAYAIVYRRLMKDFDSMSLKCPLTPDVMFSDRLMTGVCSQRCTYIVSVMRALGIPAACDLVHYWANYSPTGHSWVCLVPDDRHTLTMQPADSLPVPFGEMDASVFHVEGPAGIPSHYTVDSVKRASKVFRYSYEVHQNGFLSPFRYDVSKYYAQTQLSVCLPMKKKGELCTFASVYDWQPAARASRQWGGRARFNHLGGHIVYLPAEDSGLSSGRIKPLLPPFILEDDASVHWLEARKDSLQHLVLHRKYVLYAHWIQRWGKMVGSRFEMSDSRDFNPCELLYEVTEMPEGITSIPVCPSGPRRYVRMQVREDARPNVAELAYFDNSGRRQTGTVIADGIDASDVHKSTDGDYGTWSGSPADHYWWGYDFGSDPPALSRIEYCMRHDMNMVEPGKRYELLYYDYGWRSLGEQTALADSLEWDGPTGALYWLRCLDGGREERVFTYENGRQVWW